MCDLACRLNALMPDTEVRGVTLAAKGALDRAAQRLENPIICPWFMSDGWFVRTHLPKRLLAAGLMQWHATAPMGLMPGIGPLMRDGLCARLTELGWAADQTTVILAAHGSPTSARPREATEAAARALACNVKLKAIHPCYVDEPPAIRDIASGQQQAIVLPFFAARAGHVTGDLPYELAAACFTGPVLDPLGSWPETPTLVAAVISAMLRAAAA